MSRTGLRGDSPAIAPCGDLLSTALLRLLASPLVQGLAPREVCRLFSAFQCRTVRRGSLLSRQGRPDPQFTVIVSGDCERWRLRADGSTQRREYRAGGYFGHCCLPTGAVARRSLRMTTDGVVLVLSRRQFFDLVIEPSVRHLPRLTAREVRRQRHRRAHLRLGAGRTLDAADFCLPTQLLVAGLRELPRGRSFSVGGASERDNLVAAFLLGQAGFDVWAVEHGSRAGLTGPEAPSAGAVVSFPYGTPLAAGDLDLPSPGPGLGAVAQDDLDRRMLALIRALATLGARRQAGDNGGAPGSRDEGIFPGLD